MTALAAGSHSKKKSAQAGTDLPWGPIARFVLTAIGSVLLAMLAANAWVVSATRSLIVDNIDRLERHDVGVVLGTSPFTRYGNRNLLFDHRMLAAAELYAAGKVRHLLVSGANPDHTYNEPRKMYQALRRLGVPDAAITLDFAGFRTLDSIVRARRVFDLERFVVISQRYHAYRALFIARHNGIRAVAYVRPEEDPRQPLRAEAREYLARVMAVLDLFLLSTQPRFLGAPRPIELVAPETPDGGQPPQREPAGDRPAADHRAGENQAPAPLPDSA